MGAISARASKHKPWGTWIYTRNKENRSVGDDLFRGCCNAPAGLQARSSRGCHSWEQGKAEIVRIANGYNHRAAWILCLRSVRRASSVSDSLSTNIGTPRLRAESCVDIGLRSR